MTIIVTDDTFKKEVIESSLPVLIDLWAEWCGPCRALSPIIDQLASEFNGKVKIVKINVNENPNITSTLGIKSIPTLIFYKNGVKIETKVGTIPKNNLINWLNDLLTDSTKTA